MAKAKALREKAVETASYLTDSPLNRPYKDRPTCNPSPLKRAKRTSVHASASTARIAVGASHIYVAHAGSSVARGWKRRRRTCLSRSYKAITDRKAGVPEGPRWGCALGRQSPAEAPPNQSWSGGVLFRPSDEGGAGEVAGYVDGCAEHIEDAVDA